MSEKRFRFSLRFLIVWILVTGLVLWVCVNQSRNTLQYDSNQPPSDGIRLVWMIHRGWPFQISVVPANDEESKRLFQASTELEIIGEIPAAEYPLGLMGDLAVSSVIALLLCVLFKFLTGRKQRTFTPPDSTPPPHAAPPDSPAPYP